MRGPFKNSLIASLWKILEFALARSGWHWGQKAQVEPARLRFFWLQSYIKEAKAVALVREGH